MATLYSFTALFSFTSFVIGVILICIILYSHRQISAKFLAFFLFTLAATNFFIFLFESRLLYFMPFLFRIGPFINYLSAPALFLYVISTLDENRRLKWLDVLHLVPAIIFLIDFFPLYASSNAYKSMVIASLYQNIQNTLLIREGWLIPAGAHYQLRHVIAMFYVIYLFRLLVVKKPVNAIQKPGNEHILSWIKIVLTLFFLSSAMGVVTSFFSFSVNAWTATVWEALIICSTICMTLFFKPEILYGSFDHGAVEPQEVTQKHFILTEKNNTQVKARILTFIDNQGYLRKNIKLGDVAKELDIQVNILSAYINQVYQMRFNDFINLYRIQYISKGLTDGQWDVLTLEAIADGAGFSNRTTFLNAFKKFVGMTPTAYMQKQKDQNTLKVQNVKKVKSGL